MLDPEKTREREARLSLEEQFALNLTRAVEIVCPELAGKFRITVSKR